MAQKVTSIAIEFGVKLQEFKQDLAKAGKYSDDEQKKIVSRWISEEKKKTRTAEREAKKREKADKEAAAAMMATAANVAAAIVAAGAAAAAAFAAMRAHTHEVRTEIIGLNRETGLLPETLAAIQMAAGDEILGDLRTDLVDFNKKIAEAQNGQGELAESFKKVEASAKAQGRAFDTTDEVFRAFIAHIQDMPPSAERAELALKTFGGEGTRFMAAIGGTELEDFVELTNRFGADVSPEAIKATEEWNKASGILKDLAESTTDLLANEALALFGFRGDVRGFVKEVVIMDAKFRTFARNMGKYLSIAKGTLGSLAMVTPGVNVAVALTTDQGFFGFIDEAREAYNGLEDSTAEVEQALADLEERYKQLDAVTDESAENTSAAAHEAEQAAKDAEAAERAREQAKRQRQQDELKRLKAIEESYRRRVAFINANADVLQGPQATAFINFEYGKLGEEMFSGEIMQELGQFIDLSSAKITDEFGKSFADAFSQASAEYNEAEEKLSNNRRRRSRAERKDAADERRKEFDLKDPFDKAQMYIAAIGAFSDQTGAMISGVQELLLQKFEGNVSKQRKVMRDMFYAQKAVAISNIIISGAQAIMQAFAAGGPIMAGVMAPIVAANTAVQIAVVAQEQPGFHTGGVVPASGMAPDETSITALSGEGVVSRRGMAALDQINRGEPMGGAAPVVVYGARIFNEVDADLARMPGSSMSRAIRSRTRRRIGHRN